MRKFLTVFVFLWGVLLGEARAESVLDLSKLQWQKEWDFNARDLELAQGYPSKIGFVQQPRIDRLDVFGEIGKFPSRNQGYVGFAQLTAGISLPHDTNRIIITGDGRTPETVIRLVLFLSEYEKGSYQAEFKLDADGSKLEFNSSDFQYYVRGKLDSAMPPMDFAKVSRLGFLVTRSSQVDPDEAIKFDFSIAKIKFH